MLPRRFLALALALACTLLAGPLAAAEKVVVGSKRFTESYILGEVIAQAARQAGADSTHRQGLGNGAVVLEALKTGEIDVYPEYLGTVEREILKLVNVGLTNQQIGEKLGITVSTTKWYMTQIFGKLNVRNRTQAMARARQLKLL